MSHSLIPTHVSVSVVLALALMPFTAGCGDGGFPVADAKGKVVCNGQPVTVGTVTFAPMGEGKSLETGKPATATIGPDGTFVLTTNDRFDGAIVGKHRVTYMGPEGEDEEEGAEAKTPSEGSPEERANAAKLIKERRAQQKSQCVQQGEIILEVKADGENDFTIELVPAPR
jgi:hypothetical protein